MTWKQRARAARMTNVFIAEALGYSNRAKVSQAWSWETVPISIRLLIVLAERISPKELRDILEEVQSAGGEG